MYLLVDEAIDFPSSPSRVVAFLGEPVASTQLNDQVNAAIQGVKSLLDFVDTERDNIGDRFGSERGKDDLFVKAVEL